MLLFCWGFVGGVGGGRGLNPSDLEKRRKEKRTG